MNGKPYKASKEIYLFRMQLWRELLQLDANDMSIQGIYIIIAFIIIHVTWHFT